MLQRPTSLALAFVNAAVKQQTTSPLAQRTIDVVLKNDRPNNGYNRTMRDNIRVSPKTLASLR